MSNPIADAFNAIGTFFNNVFQQAFDGYDPGGPREPWDNPAYQSAKVQYLLNEINQWNGEEDLASEWQNYHSDYLLSTTQGYPRDWEEFPEIFPDRGAPVNWFAPSSDYSGVARWQQDDNGNGRFGDWNDTTKYFTVGFYKKHTIRAGDGIDSIVGGPLADRLYGGSGNDRVSGGSGNDYVDGGGGSDKLIGGLGSDHIMVGNGDIANGQWHADRIEFIKGSHSGKAHVTQYDKIDLNGELIRFGLLDPFAVEQRANKWAVDFDDAASFVAFGGARATIILDLEHEIPDAVYATRAQAVRASEQPWEFMEDGAFIL